MKLPTILQFTQQIMLGLRICTMKHAKLNVYKYRNQISSKLYMMFYQPIKDTAASFNGDQPTQEIL